MEGNQNNDNNNNNNLPSVNEQLEPNNESTTNVPVDTLLQNLINTREQDMNIIQNTETNINPFMRLIHRSIQLIPQQIIISDISNVLNESFNEEEIKSKPTQKEFLESLEIKEIKEEDLNKSCSICFDNFKLSEKYICLPCDDTHCYHIESSENCDGIKPWLNTNNTCPVCRYELPIEDEPDEPVLEPDKIQEQSEEQEPIEEELNQDQFQHIAVITAEQILQDAFNENTPLIPQELPIIEQQEGQGEQEGQQYHLNDQERERIMRLLHQRLQHRVNLSMQRPIISLPSINGMDSITDTITDTITNTMTDIISEDDGFSDMDMDEAIRRSLE